MTTTLSGKTSITTILCSAAISIATVSAALPAHADAATGNGLVTESAYALQNQNWHAAARLAAGALKSGDLEEVTTASAYNNLCIALTELKRFDDAKTACDAAVGMAPTQWGVYNNRGNLYFHLGDLKQALADYTQAGTLSPGEGVVSENIELTELASGLEGNSSKYVALSVNYVK